MFARQFSYAKTHNRWDLISLTWSFNLSLHLHRYNFYSKCNNANQRVSYFKTLFLITFSNSVLLRWKYPTTLQTIFSVPKKPIIMALSFLSFSPFSLYLEKMLYVDMNCLSTYGKNDLNHFPKKDMYVFWEILYDLWHFKL